MQSSSIISYLRDLCCDIDEGRPLQRFAWRRAVGTLAVPVAIGLASLAPGCAQEDCHDGVDNDSDNKVDCADTDCFDVCGANAEYAAPFPNAVNEYGAPFHFDPGPAVEAYGVPFPDVEPPKPPEPDSNDIGSQVPMYGTPPHIQDPNDGTGPNPAPLPRYIAPFPNNVRRYGAPMF